MLRKILKLLLSRMFIVGILIFLQLLTLYLVFAIMGDFYLIFNTFSVIFAMMLALYIINNTNNPSYKIVWLIVILLSPYIGLILYVSFGGDGSDKKTKKKIFLINEKRQKYLIQNEEVMKKLKQENIDAYLQNNYLINTAYYPTYRNTKLKYYEIGEKFKDDLIDKLKKAQKFIFMEYFIIEEGKFWNEILEVLKEKALDGVDVRIIYDDLGCIQTLPKNYSKYLKKYGIKCSTFNDFIPIISSKLNNRDHRKITVIDNKYAFTGGLNLADEYINEIVRFGHWKDNGILLEGEAVWNMTVMFLATWDYSNNISEDFEKFKIDHKVKSKSYVNPFDDSPYDKETVSKNVYLNLINKAKDYVYIITPYFIVDNELMTAITTASKNGVEVRIIVPGIADKKTVNEVTKSYYDQLLESKVRIFEYEPGFIHGKTVIADDEYAIIGTVNMDFRSLYLHFENGVLIYKDEVIDEIKKDFTETFKICREVSLQESKNIGIIRKIYRALLRIFAPLM